MARRKFEKKVKAKVIGINHIALEVGDVEAALKFYGAIFNFELRGQTENAAFIDLGDQFLQLTCSKNIESDDKRHFGLVVDDREPVRAALEQLGIGLIGRGMNFHDPWGNRVEVVSYEDIQFTKVPGVLRRLGLQNLDKTPAAIAEINKKEMCS